MGRFFPLHPLILLHFFLSRIFSSVGISPVQMIRAVGDTVTFPTSVPVSGNLYFNGDTIGLVVKKVTETDISDDFMNRVHWWNQTGFFTLSDLRRNDSGCYTVESTKPPKSSQDYQLEVYEIVSDPHVKNTVYNSSEFCSVLCTVWYVKGLDLAWYEDQRLISSSNSSNGFNVTISLLEIRNLANHVYSCVASNPISNKSTPIDITLHCPLYTDVDPGVVHESFSVLAITVMCAVMAVSVGVVCLRKRNENESGCCTDDRKIHESPSEWTTAVYQVHKLKKDEEEFWIE